MRKPEEDERPDIKTRFQTGNSGGGRPKGSRNRLSEAFLSALDADFEQHGPDVITKVRIEKPDVYLKVVANLMPARLEAQLEAKIDVGIGEFSDNSIPDILELVTREAGTEAAQLLAQMFGIPMPGSTETIKLIPPVQNSDSTPRAEALKRAKQPFNTLEEAEANLMDQGCKYDEMDGFWHDRSGKVESEVIPLGDMYQIKQWLAK